VTISIDDAAHLLRRTSFGCTTADATALANASATRAAAVEWVLDVGQNPPAVVPTFPGPDATWANFEVLRAAWLDTMRVAPRPLLERLVLFWHGHFAMRIEQPVPFLDRAQLNTLRAKAAGSFRDLLQAIAILPEMLLFLNGFENVAAFPNQNFARELMELFTLGVDQYTLTDVKETARAWSGHGFVLTGGDDVVAYHFDPTKHDAGNKTIFGITKPWDGPQVLDEITLGSKAATSAAFIATKVWRHFVGAPPSSSTLATISAAFTASGLNTIALCRAILNHDDFWDPAGRFSMVRPPADWAVAVLRCTGLPVSAFSDGTGASLARMLDDMGQALLRPASVAGWGDGRYWVSASTAWARAAFAAKVRDIACPVDQPLRPDGFLHPTSSMTVADAVQSALSAFGITTPTSTTRASLESWLTAERQRGGPAAAQEAVRGLIELTLLSPEVQMA